MAASLLGLATFADLGFQEIASRGRSLQARYLAESGVAIGLHPQIKRESGLLHQSTPDGRIDVDLLSEQGRLNINTTLSKGAHVDVLLRLFSIWGMKDDQARRLADILADWMNPPALKRLNGAEAADYARMGFPGLPPNRPFPSIDEMEMVPGIGDLAKLKPDWKNAFTVFGDGKLDLNEAPADLIEAVCGVGSAAANGFVSLRDGQGGHASRITYDTVSSALAALGLAGELAQAVQDRVCLGSPFRRIRSVGTVGSYRHTIGVVIKLNAGAPQYLSWSE